MTPKQREATDHNGSHARIIAGPGTGKTSVLVAHILNSIQNFGINAKSMLVLAFNRSIAEKLRDDLMNALGNDETRLPIIMTLHSYALKLMKKFRIAHELGNTTFPSEAEMTQVDKVIAHYLRKRDFQFKGKKVSLIVVKALWPLFSRFRWYGQKLDEMELEEPLKEFNDAVEFSKKFFGINFLGELPGQLRLLLAKEPEARKTFQKIVVDEYQDLNPEDIAVIKAISQDQSEVIIAGDDDQSICSYRGADSQGLKRFESEYADVKCFELDECFRCPEKVFNYAGEIINQIPAKERIVKTIKCSCEFTGLIVPWQFKSPKSQQENILQLVKSYLDKCDEEFTKGKAQSEKSVLVIVPRAALVKVYIQGLSDLGVSVEDLSKYDTDRNLLKFWYFLRVVVNPSDQLALQNILEMKEPRWIQLFERLLDKMNWGMYEGNLRECLQKHRSDIEASVQAENKKALANVFGLITVLEQYSSSIPIDLEDIRGTLLLILKACSEFFQDLDDTKIALIIDEVANQIHKSGAEIEDSFEILAFFLPIIEEKPNPDPNIKVQVTTLRRAKGLQADFVIIPDLEDNILPGNLELAEARRLLYVAVTRSQRLLLVSCVRARRGGYASGHKGLWKQPSRLLPASPQILEGEKEAKRILGDIKILNEVR
jgi:DNA helicase II / ATP-dependent DNA helicase PcrA